jgi:hypothetical protein
LILLGGKKAGILGEHWPNSLGAKLLRVIDVSSLVDLASCSGGFLREQMRGFHDLLRQNPTSLFMLLGWSSISMASLMMWSIIGSWWRG